ncbi:hypothetical protein [Helicobacter sp. 16-1353]|nr:hypothetical protein [Helicobacter sp. 16-1353]
MAKRRGAKYGRCAGNKKVCGVKGEVKEVATNEEFSLVEVVNKALKSS